MQSTMARTFGPPCFSRGAPYPAYGAIILKALNPPLRSSPPTKRASVAAPALRHAQRTRWLYRKTGLLATATAARHASRVVPSAPPSPTRPRDGKRMCQRSWPSCSRIAPSTTSRAAAWGTNRCGHVATLKNHSVFGHFVNGRGVTLVGFIPVASKVWRRILQKRSTEYSGGALRYFLTGFPEPHYRIRSVKSALE